MNGPDRLRDAARFYLQESEQAGDQKDKEYFADCAFELAQMAEALERALLDETSSVSSIDLEATRRGSAPFWGDADQEHDRRHERE